MQKDIKTIVEETFKKFPTVKEVYATADGNVFIEENRAILHAGANGKYSTYTKDVEETVDVTPIKLRDSKELIAEIKQVQELDDLQKYVPGETRKTVLAAIEKRTAELITATIEESDNVSDEELSETTTNQTDNIQE